MLRFYTSQHTVFLWTSLTRTFVRTRHAIRIGMAAWIMLIMPTLASALTFGVTIDDPLHVFSEFHAALESHVVASGAAWDAYILGNASLEVFIGFSSSIPRTTGRSFTSAFVRHNGTFDVLEQGAAAEIRTGIDPNGTDHDIEIMFNPDHLTHELWFDPDPFARTAPVPVHRTDAVSVFLHEMGHAFAFNGWLDHVTGVHPGTFESTFDEHTMFDGSDFFFLGPQAVAHYGAPVPLTFGNYPHFGNAAPRAGSDLIPDLMNGVAFFRGSRYDISALDVALLADVGVPVRAVVSEPSTVILLSLSLGGLLGLHRRSQHKQGASW